MSCNMVRFVWAATAAMALGGPASAATYFSEDFTSGTANWQFNTANSPPLSSVPTGGPDNGAYASHTMTLPTGASQLLFRAHTFFGSSGLGYTGNWQSLGVYEVSAWVRQNTGQPLVFNARIAGENNFPGASYYSVIDPTPANVPSGVWTKVTFDVTPTSPQNVVYETNYADVFSAVGNMQFGINIPTALRGAGPYTFDIDKVTVERVPEPAAGALASLAALGLGAARRRRSS